MELTIIIIIIIWTRGRSLMLQPQLKTWPQLKWNHTRCVKYPNLHLSTIVCMDVQYSSFGTQQFLIPGIPLHCQHIACLSVPNYSNGNKKFWEELITYFLRIYHGPHRKRCAKKFFIVECVSVAAVTFLLSSCNGRGAHRLVEWIYKLRRWDGLRSHDIHTKFYEDWLRHFKVDDTHTALLIS
jgi:hypothetical protein